MDGKPEVHQDAQFELASMMLEVAIWFSKYGSRVSAKESISEEDAKEVLKMFKKAAGIFQAIPSQAERLLDKPDPGTDLDHHILGNSVLISRVFLYLHFRLLHAAVKSRSSRSHHRTRCPAQT